MNLNDLATRFVELCNQGKNFEVMETMYAPDIVSVEASGAETAGQQPVIEKSKRWAAVNEIHGEKVLGPYLNGTEQFAVFFTFEVTPKATGKRTKLDEIGVYTVKNGKITREQFFFVGDR